MKTLRKLLLASGAALLAGAVAIPVATADEVADFYKRKRITVYIGYSAGGGYDLYARTLARHMGRHIPGNPRMVAKNRPGAGSMILTNDLYNTLPQDGTAIATVGRGMATEPLFENPQAKFDPREFNWIGSMNNEVSVCVAWHDVPVNVWEDLKTRGLIVGGTATGSDTDTFPTVLNNVLGTKMKLITGYPGGNDINFAIERGEVEGRCGWSWSSVKSTRGQWLKEKKIKVLLQMSTAKHPELPTVPFVMDLAENERDLKILKIVFARQMWGRPFLAGPGVPEARVAALRAAFEATMKDPKFLAEVKRQKMELTPISGEVIQDAVAELYETEPETVKAAIKATTYTGNIEISKAQIPVETVTAEITSVKRGGRSVAWKAGGKEGKVKVSGRRTEVKIAGKEADRKELEPGMSCEFTYQGSAAKSIHCD